MVGQAGFSQKIFIDIVCNRTEFYYFYKLFYIKPGRKL
jgi:hypothetical protein